MIIDINMDNLPESLFKDEALLDGFLSTAPRGYGEIATLGATPDGRPQITLEKPKGYQNLRYTEGEYTLEVKLRAMDEAGVDIAMLRVPVWQEWLRLDTCKKINDAAADMCRRSNGRLYAFACVPPWGGKENLYEAERCVKELGMVAVQAACHYGQLYLDDEVFRPHLKTVEKLGVPLVVHHTPLPVEWKYIYQWNNMRREMGRLMDQATAVGREVFSGMFDELPGLKCIHTFLGGAWFAYSDLLTPAKGQQKNTGTLTVSDNERIQGYLKNNIYYEATHPATWGKKQIKCAIDVCGADHVLFGSAFPIFYNWMADGVRFMNELDITDAERELVMCGNATRLFNLKV